ncbi:MAG TPA: hypothetical protein VFQ17_13525 [Nocardioides sp.]|nr:hypothetical protein [Nocardioides sp.]
MQRIKSGLTALAVGIVLLAALDWAAAAATGQSLVLGKWNQAGQTTTIKNVGNGPALDIRAKGPALEVHNTKRIKHLNADKLDGKDAADLAASKQKVYVYGATSRVGGFTQNLPAQPAGSYLVAYSAQFVGAAGSTANPNTVTCHITVSSVSGTTATTKAVLAEAQVASVESPPAVSGVGTLGLAAGDQVALVCTMSRPNQQWSTSALQPIQVTFLHTDGATAISAPLGRSANR